MSAFLTHMDRIQKAIHQEVANLWVWEDDIARDADAFRRVLALVLRYRMVDTQFLAAVLGFSRQQINRWAKGDAVPSVAVRQRAMFHMRLHGQFSPNIPQRYDGEAPPC